MHFEARSPFAHRSANGWIQERWITRRQPVELVLHLGDPFQMPTQLLVDVVEVRHDPLQDVVLVQGPAEASQPFRAWLPAVPAPSLRPSWPARALEPRSPVAPFFPCRTTRSALAMGTKLYLCRLPYVFQTAQSTSDCQAGFVSGRARGSTHGRKCAKAHTNCRRSLKDVTP